MNMSTGIRDVGPAPVLAAGLIAVLLAFLLLWPEPPPRVAKRTPQKAPPAVTHSGPTKEAQVAQIALIKAANEHRIKPAVLLAISYFETARTFSTTIRPKRGKKFIGSAIGLCQFIKQTRVHYGLPRSNKLMSRTSAEQQAQACARLTRDNKKSLVNLLGHAPSPGEIYLAHFLGAGRASQLIKVPPGTRITAVVSARARRANAVLRRYKTARGVRQWARKHMAQGMNRVAKYYRRAPTVAGWVATITDLEFFAEESTGERK